MGACQSSSDITVDPVTKPAAKTQKVAEVKSESAKPNSRNDISETPKTAKDTIQSDSSHLSKQQPPARPTASNEQKTAKQPTSFSAAVAPEPNEEASAPATPASPAAESAVISEPEISHAESVQSLAQMSEASSTRGQENIPDHYWRAQVFTYLNYVEIAETIQFLSKKDREALYDHPDVG